MKTKKLKAKIGIPEYSLSKKFDSPAKTPKQKRAI